MISAIYVLDSKGKIIICRDYRGDISHNCVETFSSKLVEEVGDFAPVFEDDGIHYIFQQHSNLYCMIFFFAQVISFGCDEKKR